MQSVEVAYEQKIVLIISLVLPMKYLVRSLLHGIGSGYV